MNSLPKDINNIIGFYVWKHQCDSVFRELQNYMISIKYTMSDLFTYYTYKCDCDDYQHCERCNNIYQNKYIDIDMNSYTLRWCHKCKTYTFFHIKSNACHMHSYDTIFGDDDNNSIDERNLYCCCSDKLSDICYCGLDWKDPYIFGDSVDEFDDEYV